MKVYITVPFTSKLDEKGVVQEDFIKFVDRLDSRPTKFDPSTYIPDRDFFKWGKVTFNPDTVYNKFRMELKAADLVVAVNPDEGISTNLVLGIAASLKKEVLIILKKEFENNRMAGLMYRGLRNMTKVRIVFYGDQQELERKLRKEIKDFIKSKKS